MDIQWFVILFSVRLIRLICKIKHKKQYKINWSILFRCSSVKASGNDCNLCLKEKLQIIFNHNSSSSLIKVPLQANFFIGDVKSRHDFYYICPKIF